MNPRAAINDLLPFQGSPFGQLGYFSKLPYYSEQLLYYIMVCRFCQALFLLFQKLFCCFPATRLLYHVFAFLSTTFFKTFSVSSGESGIRTHAPLRTNGFQDRLVMTTSISLRIFAHLLSAKLILTLFSLYVKNFFYFFTFFYDIYSHHTKYNLFVLRYLSPKQLLNKHKKQIYS